MLNSLTSILKPLVLGLAMAALIVLTQSVVRADPVVYSTTGAFASNGGLNTLTFGSGGNTVTFSFAGVTNNSVNTTTTGSLGDITTTVRGTGYSGGLVSSGFTLTINQSIPCGTISGTISMVNQSTFALVLSIPTTTINGITYTAQTVYLIVPPTNGGVGGAVSGVTSLQGTITGAAVPEPTSMLLLGTGLVGVAGAARRRFRIRK